MDGGECSSTCGVNGYGSATYHERAVADSTTCSTCHNSCHTCNGSGSSRCTSCNNGEFLARVANGATYFTYGDCQAKDQWVWYNSTLDFLNLVINGVPINGMQSGTYTANIYIDPPGSNALAVESITGASGNRFNYIQDGIAKAYEEGAEHTYSKITIWLGDSSTTSHAMTRGDADLYIPSRIDDRSSVTKIVLKTISGAQETVLYKLRDKHVFKIGWAMEFYDIIFDAVDSVCDSCTDPKETTNTCSNTGSSLGGGCSYKRDPTELCPGAATGSFFEF